jgi:predicted phosphodiesterase
MRYAIVSDIHGNQQAWKSVLEDIASVGVDEIICLGDIVGYGPCPTEVLESVWEQAADIVLGNHDAVVGGQLDPEIFTENAKRMINWTMETLDPALHHLLADVPYVLEGDGFAMAHAELAFPDRFAYIDNEQDAAENFSAGDQRILFVGHSHVPKIFVLHEDSGDVGQLPVHDLVTGEGQRYIVNVGSVGDPRDGRTLASYCLFDSDKQLISHRSVTFDIEEFRADLESRRVPVKPWFLMCWDKQGAGSRRIDEWSKNVRTVVRPKKRIVIRRIQREVEDSEQSRLVAERALVRKQELLKTVEKAKQDRIERGRRRERRREDEGAAVREALRLRREKAAARKKSEEEKQADTRKIPAQKPGLIAAVAKMKAEQKQTGKAKSPPLSEAVRKQKIAAAKAKPREQAAQPELDEKKAELVRQRKLELAKAAERRMKAKREARGAIEEKREAERERVRKQIKRRKQLAAEKSAASDKPLSTDGEGPRPTGDQ